jgi:hypothetical protein
MIFDGFSGKTHFLRTWIPLGIISSPFEITYAEENRNRKRWLKHISDNELGSSPAERAQL